MASTSGHLQIKKGNGIMPEERVIIERLAELLFKENLITSEEKRNVSELLGEAVEK